MLIVDILGLLDALPLFEEPVLHTLHILDFVLGALELELGELLVLLELDLLEVELRNRVQVEQVDVIDEPAQLDVQGSDVFCLDDVLHDLVGLVQGVVRGVLPQHHLELLGGLPRYIVWGDLRDYSQHDIDLLFGSLVQQTVRDALRAVKLGVDHAV